MKLDNLNEMQKQAVTTTEGPLLVLAGAGSGKTKVLTTRIAYLVLEKNVDPSNILAITFTNKAAFEMKQRVGEMLGMLVHKIQISTFHSFGLSIIKQNYDKLNLKSNFTIIDSDDSLVTIKKILKDMGIDPKEYNPRGIKSKISGAKNSLIDCYEYEKYANSEFEKIVLEVYRKYEQKLHNNNSLDFDDLLVYPINLFRKYPNILKKYQEKFKYILIDEYQDTNEVQYILSKMISAKYKNICVVGDNDQSIYSFRQADYRNILNFEKDYNNAKTIMLEQNYRSTAMILKAANDVIKNNKQRKDKILWTENNEGVKIHYKQAYDEKDEAYYVYQEINKLLAKNVSKKDIVVLYRTNAQSRNMEEILIRENIPYRVIGSFYFYSRKEIKDLISYLKVIYNPSDDINLQRIINTPKRGIGLKTISNLVDKANLENKSIFDVIDSGKELQFKKTIEELITLKEKHTLTELIDLILDKTKMKKELEEENSIVSLSRLENLEEFKTITKTFEEEGIVSLEDFLNEISLVSDIEEHKNNNDVITLMTVHSAKGLEFDNVFIIGLEEGIFPHANSLFNQEELEEERRLCYVAITRAKKELWLVNAKRRTIYGSTNCNEPSRFISEISDDYLDCNDEQSFEIDDLGDYKLGDHVCHKIFGQGVIIKIDDDTYTIAFSNKYGIRKISKTHKSLRKE